MTPIVAIVGRPNVGKSTLFNRLVGARRSIVADEPGVTRDRIYAEATLAGAVDDRAVIMIDTGGFDPRSADPIMQRVLDQTQLALDEADVVVFVADSRSGLMPEDLQIAKVLRKSDKRVIVAVNKVDGDRHDLLVGEFHRLGLDDITPISAAHGRGVNDLQELIVAQLPEADKATGDAPDDAGPIRVAVIGRPNVGKSSLINRVLGEDRHLVSEMAGTTRDSIDSLLERDGRQYLLIDTAGIRRKRSIAMRVEKFSVLAALRGLDRSDVALLMIDSTQTVAMQDARVSAFAYEKGRAVILVVSKWDMTKGETDIKAYTEKVRQELRHLAYAPIIFTSAKTGYGLDRLFSMIKKVHEQHAKRVTTGQLNRFVERVMENHPPPTKKGKRGKIFYMTQIGVQPPRFLVSVNDPKVIHFSYRRYLINEIRKEYGFEGVPLLVGYRARIKADNPKRKPKRNVKPMHKHRK